MMMTNELVAFINNLIDNDQLDVFYHRKEWKRLKKSILKCDHYECQKCKESGRLTILNDSSPVHHVKEVKTHPWLALSKYYYDVNGHRQRQLISLCFDCHNEIHNRFCRNENKFMNEERW